ncbi:MAG: hypothetical protein ACYDHF_07990 [Candidatus Cryosericum sp.]
MITKDSRRLHGMGDNNAAYTPADFSLSAPAPAPYTNAPVTGASSDFSLAPTGTAPSIGANTTTFLDVNTPVPGSYTAPDILTGGNANALIPLDISGQPATSSAPSNSFSNLISSAANLLVKKTSPTIAYTQSPAYSPVYATSPAPYGVPQNAVLTSSAPNTMLYLSLGIGAVLLLLALRK